MGTLVIKKVGPYGTGGSPSISIELTPAEVKLFDIIGMKRTSGHTTMT